MRLGKNGHMVPEGHRAGSSWKLEPEVKKSQGWSQESGGASDL